MKSLQKFGGIAALYMAFAHLTGILVFIVVLDYINITDLAQKVAVNVANQAVVFSTNLLMYVFFGFFLVVLSLALYDRLKSGAPALMQVAAAIIPLYAKDPVQASITWQGIEVVANGLGNANGEILGGLMTLLVSLAGLRSKGLPKALNFLGLLVGSVGIVTLIPALNPFVSVFGVGQIAWFIWMAIVLLRRNSALPN